MNYTIRIRPAEGGFILALEKLVYEGSGLSALTLSGGNLKTYEYVCTSMDDVCAKLRAIVASQK